MVEGDRLVLSLSKTVLWPPSRLCQDRLLANRGISRLLVSRICEFTVPTVSVPGLHAAPSLPLGIALPSFINQPTEEAFSSRAARHDWKWAMYSDHRSIGLDMTAP